MESMKRLKMEKVHTSNIHIQRNNQRMLSFINRKHKYKILKMAFLYKDINNF